MPLKRNLLGIPAFDVAGRTGGPPEATFRPADATSSGVEFATWSRCSWLARSQTVLLGGKLAAHVSARLLPTGLDVLLFLTGNRMF